MSIPPIKSPQASGGGEERLRQRNESGVHPYQVDEATYDLFMSYFVPPTADEGFIIVTHKP